MRSNNAMFAVVLGAGVAALCTSACKKSPEVEHRASEAELRSALTEPPRTRVADDRNGYFATVRREQLQLRARIQDDIADIDQNLAALKVERRDGRYVFDREAKNAARIKQLLERRSRLYEHALTVERADERGWDDLKATVEQDLRE